MKRIGGFACRRSLNFWTLQFCLLSSNWSACKHLFLDKLLILRGLARGWKLYPSNMKRLLDFAPWKGIWFRESRKILLLESGILGFGLRNSTQEIWNPTSDMESRIQVRLTNSGLQYLECGIHGVEFKIQDCPRFPGRSIQSLSRVHQTRTSERKAVIVVTKENRF